MSITTELDTMTNIHANLAATLQQQGVSALLPAHVTDEQFTRTAATAMVQDPDLQLANKQSLVLALTRCARDGLLPDGREAALVVRNTKNYSTGQYEKRVVYMPMVDGVLKRARQSGQVANIIAKVVYASDEFDYRIDELGEHLLHRPAFRDGDAVAKVYAFARLTSGEIVVEVMSKADVERIRDNQFKSDKIPAVWRTWFDRMALKTVLHRLARRLPNASELFSLLEVGRDMAEGEKIVSDAAQARTSPRLRDELRRRGHETQEPSVATTSGKGLPRASAQNNTGIQGKSEEGAEPGAGTTSEKEIVTANGEVRAPDSATNDNALKCQKEGGQHAICDSSMGHQTPVGGVAHCPDRNHSANPSPRLEALLNALDDTSDEASCSEVVTHCAKVADSLTDDEKATLRAKISATKARLAYRASGGKVTIVPFTNASQTAWRFPDGTMETSSWKAEQRARALNMRLEERQRGRFSASH